MKLALSSLLICASAIVSALAIPDDHGADQWKPLSARAGTPISEGFHDNFFYSWWTDGQATAYYTNDNGGTYSIEWSGSGSLKGGKGWKPGSTGRVINYNGTYQPRGDSFLAIYGWTRNPLIEYYILESYGTYNPASAAVKKGTVTCNGASYDILYTWRDNPLAIDGPMRHQQFWSVRHPKKTPGGQINGTVDTLCHFNGWETAGLSLGTNHYYHIVATEGNSSGGSASITVS